MPKYFRKIHHLHHRSISRKSITKPIQELKGAYDVVVIGGGHNGLISAAYLRKSGYSVCVLERRDVLGGAAVTEEIIPGFKFSRASYVLSLLRPFIISDLKLKEFGLKLHLREPFSSYTPLKESLWRSSGGRSLLLGPNLKLSCGEISKFSQRDAAYYGKYEEQMSRFVRTVLTLLDNRAPHFGGSASLPEKAQGLATILKALKHLRLEDMASFHEIMTAPAAKLLDRWFESDVLKATLGTDAVIGTMSGPHSPGTGYVLLHHIMGGVEGSPGAWAYPEGGMGAVSCSIAASAASLGVDLFTGVEVEAINYVGGRAVGVSVGGVSAAAAAQVEGKVAVFSNATPHTTFNILTKRADAEEVFGQDFISAVNRIDYTSPVTKINVALSRLPNFRANPHPSTSPPQPHHRCTIHLNCESLQELESSFRDCERNRVPSKRPMMELTIPSSVDPTLVPGGGGAHVCLLFTQYTPLTPSDGGWEDPEYKEAYAATVFDVVEEYAPGFKESVVGKEVLSPWDLEKVFGLTGGNIFHGAMSVDQLWWLRPFRSEACWFPATPAKGLYLCGSGAHPGGGVMGLPGYLAAKALLSSRKNDD